MGKGAIQKKAPSRHSRAARRATSPGIDADKSLKEVALPDQGSSSRSAILAAHSGAGVSKKTSKRKAVLSSKARKRHEKAFDRAEAVMERTILKVEKSKGNAKTVQSRRKDWGNINKGITTNRKGLYDILATRDNDSSEDDSISSAEAVELDDEMGGTVPNIASLPVEASDDVDDIS